MNRTNSFNHSDSPVRYYLRFACSVSHVQLFLRPHGLQPTMLLCEPNFPGKNTGVGCHFLLQGICPTHCHFLLQGSPLHR